MKQGGTGRGWGQGELPGHHYTEGNRRRSDGLTLSGCAAAASREQRDRRGGGRS